MGRRMLTEAASREFTRSMWPVHALFAVIWTVMAVLNISSDGVGASWPMILAALGFASLALAAQRRWLPRPPRRPVRGQ